MKKLLDPDLFRPNNNSELNLNSLDNSSINLMKCVLMCIRFIKKND